MRQRSTRRRSTEQDRADQALVEACVSGDDRAWEELVRRYQRLVFSIARRSGLDVTAAEDVAQEVFAALVRHLSGLRSHRALPQWLMTTAQRVAVRHRQRARPVATDSADAIESAMPPELLDRWERQNQVLEALRHLGGRCEELLVALYVQSGPPRYEEVARKLDMPVGSIGPSRARCLEKLLEILERSPDPGVSGSPGSAL
ncbi:MAG: sigma-70 family RNA polymerase sigma factor [Planctomycetes bacterium]|nr:sigma-70 family RNA polymerase sigma factor [Planctomycetota bacterium]